jgi:hypothetical protein
MVSTNMPSIQTAIAFPFQDPAWFRKFLIGSILVFASFLIPVVPVLFVLGYAMRVMHRIIVQDGEPYLPEWDDWDRLIIDGVRLFAAGLVYSLPFIFLFISGYLIAYLPAFFTTLLEDAATSSDAVLFLLPFLGMVFGFICMGISILLGVGLGFLFPAALGHLIAEDRFSAAFQLSAWWPVFRANFTGFLVAYLLALGITMLGTFIFQVFYFTVILCCLIPLVISAFSMYFLLVSLTLFAQAYHQGVARLADSGLLKA